MMILLLKVFADSSCQADFPQAATATAAVAIVVAIVLFIVALTLKGEAVAQFSLLFVSGSLAHFAAFMFLWNPKSADLTADQQQWLLMFSPDLAANEQALLLMLRENPGSVQEQAHEQALLFMLREKPAKELAVTQAVGAHRNAITTVEVRTATVEAMTAAVNAAQEGPALPEAKAALDAAMVALGVASETLHAARTTLAPTRNALSLLLDDGVGGAGRVLDGATASLTAATTAEVRAVSALS
jgi:hypothetical protein